MGGLGGRAPRVSADPSPIDPDRAVPDEGLEATQGHVGVDRAFDELFAART